MPQIKKKPSKKRVPLPKKTSRGVKQDRRLRSKEDWERGRGARKIGNPRYKPVIISDKNGVKRKVYHLRKPDKKKPSKKQVKKKTTTVDEMSDMFNKLKI